jgi:hypothetical protein
MELGTKTMNNEFNLDQAIDAVYLPYIREIKRGEEAAKAEAERILVEAIAEFREEFDQVLAPQIQEALGIEFFQNSDRPEARNGILSSFRYQGLTVTILRSTPNDHWYIAPTGMKSLNVPASTFTQDLLILLGEIRQIFTEEPDDGNDDGI